MERSHGGHKEPFGSRLVVGDIVGCFLDADRSSISKIDKKNLRHCVTKSSFKCQKFRSLTLVLPLTVCVIYVTILITQEEKVFGGASESFGKQWGPGDIVGVFLDLVDHTISKKIFDQSIILHH